MIRIRIRIAATPPSTQTAADGGTTGFQSEPLNRRIAAPTATTIASIRKSGITSIVCQALPPPAPVTTPVSASPLFGALSPYQSKNIRTKSRIAAIR